MLLQEPISTVTLSSVPGGPGAGVEMGLALAGIPVRKEGVRAAADYLEECARTPARTRAK